LFVSPLLLSGLLNQATQFPAKKNPGLSRGFLRFKKWSRHASPTQKTPGPSRRLRRRLRRRMFLQAAMVIWNQTLTRILREYDKWPVWCQVKTSP
jgi:hypothetical protein